MNPIHIGSRREFFWDDYLIAETNAQIVQHEPVYRGDVFTCDHPWEGNNCMYFVVLQDEDRYRMYYRGQDIFNDDGTEFIIQQRGVWCYAESTDGIHWDRPNLGLWEFQGSMDNNIILGDKWRDNFYVFKDTNPNCPPEARYKGLEGLSDPFGLHCYTSADGIHFTYQGLVTDNGAFDSMNVCFWDSQAEEYRCYLRDFHGSTDPNDKFGPGSIRDVRLSRSKDFVTWTEPEQIAFMEGQPDLPLYTNQIQPYYRGEHVRIGFPTRYIERHWSESFDALPAPQHRKNRMGTTERLGTAITDCVVMTSRDGTHFDRRDEVFMGPGPESYVNWVYGDGFPAYGILEVPSPIPGADPEIAMFLPRNNQVKPVTVSRWGIRRDGFFSLKSTYKPCFLKTKPLIFAGSQLHLNFSTSAAGSMVLTLITEDGTRYDSCEIFGDSTDRIIAFPGLSDLSCLAGKPVVLEATMRDSHLYSIQFQ